MALFCSILAALVLGGTSASPTSHTLVARQSPSCNEPVFLNASTNIWRDYTLAPNSFYRSLANKAAENITDPTDKAKALRIANTGNFIWMQANPSMIAHWMVLANVHSSESPNDISKIDQVGENVPCTSIIGLVIAGLPLKACSSPPPSYSYNTDFLTPLVSKLSSHPSTAFALILEPGVLADFVLNSGASCQDLRESWYANVPAALRALNLPNVITYLDGGHGGLFGWTGSTWQGSTSVVPKWFHEEKGMPINAARELDGTWKAGGGKELTQFRGLAVNVRGYNSWDLSPGESFRGENSCYDLYNRGRNEKRYLEYLRVAGFKAINSSMPFHNIMDTSRSGQQGIREGWDDWCNVNGAGAGRRPSNETGDVNLDAFVWASAIGVSDGASEVGHAGYVANCAKGDSYKPMPERGQFSQEYFEMGLKGCRGCARRRQVEMGRMSKRCG